MSYKDAREELILKAEGEFERGNLGYLWDDWERQIREDERERIFSNLADNIIKELGDDTIELIKELQERYN